MNIVLFGASGMIGQGVLRECLMDPAVESVLSVCRRPSGQQHPKLRELIHADFYDFSQVEPALSGFDACFFCLGVSSAGMKEEAYRRITYGITLAAANTLIQLNPDMTFIYVSGAGTDSSERGRIMWARVKGETENALLRMPFKSVCVFRPAMVVPLNGIKSRTKLYRIIYDTLGPILPMIHAAVPKYTTTTARIGQAMLKIAKQGAPKPVLENADINHA